MEAIVQSNQVFPFIATVPDDDLGKGLANGFPSGVDASAVPDMGVRMVALQLLVALRDTIRPDVAM